MRLKHSTPISNIIYIGNSDDIFQDIKLKIKKQKINYNINFVKDTDEAYNFIQKNECYGIISEYEIPKINGIKFLDKIRQDFDIPFVLVMDEEDRKNEEIINALIRYSSTDYIFKDIDNVDIIINRINNLINRYISEQKIVEQTNEIKSKQRFTDQAINSLQDIFFVLKIDGSVKTLNKSGQKFVNKELDRDVKHIYNLFSDGQQKQIKNILHSVKQGKNVRANLDTETKDGKKIEFEVKKSPLSNSSGDIIGIVGIARDVTKQNEYRRNLKYKNKKLDKFAKIISHDIRNPVSIAKGNLDIYRKENKDNKQINTTYKSIERIEEILENILEISKIDDAELETKYQNINYITDKCWDNLQTGNAKLNVRTNKMLFMNDKLASRLFENLFKNSIEHGGDDVIITIGAMNNGFYVEDNGPGIPKEKRSKIFDVSYTTSGTGLGLTIVEHVCDIHHWDIKVTESSTGGARFEIKIN